MQKKCEDSSDDASGYSEPEEPMKKAKVMWEPGIDHVVREAAGLHPDIVVFPKLEDMPSFRHRWVLRRRKRPMVPAPTHTPMPDKESSRAGKSRLLSVYMRPWVLDRRFVSRHVPLMADLDVVPDIEACCAARAKLS